MVKRFSSCILVVVVISGILYWGGYLNEAYNAILANIPIIGDVMFFTDTYKLFYITCIKDIETWEQVGMIVSLVASVIGTIKLNSSFDDIQLKYKRIVMILIGFGINCLVRIVWFDGIGYFFEMSTAFMEKSNLWK